MLSYPPVEPPTYEHHPDCENNAWFKCSTCGSVFPPQGSGRGKNRCPDCYMMAAQMDGCICQEIPALDDGDARYDRMKDEGLQ